MNINGVTILNYHTDERIPLPWFIVLLAITGLIIFSICMVTFGIDADSVIGGIIGSLTLAVVGAGCLALLLACTGTLEDKKYVDVLIFDDVSINDIYEHYEIEEVNGLVYTLRIKENTFE